MYFRVAFGKLVISLHSLILDVTVSYSRIYIYFFKRSLSSKNLENMCWELELLRHIKV
jgi:hypothetical protein